MDTQTQQAWEQKMDHFVNKPSVRIVDHQPRPNPMHEAIETGQIEVVGYLLFQHDFRVDDRQGSPGGQQMGLGIAAERGDLEMVKLLLKAGADIFYSGSRGLALTQAVWNNCEAVAGFLLAETRRMIYEGAPQAVHDGRGHGMTFLLEDTKRRIRGDRSVVQMSEEDYSQLTRPALNAAIGVQNERLVKLLVSEVGSLNHEPGKVLLRAVEVKSVDLTGGGIHRDVWAAEMGLTEIVKALVDAGANPDFLDGSSRTPLSLAAEQGHVETVQLLLGYGANITLRDSVRNWRPLDWAFNGQKPDVVEILQPLTDRG
ncbi:ankyrin repeat-containing domain protein [Aspergillus spectabilis]